MENVLSSDINLKDGLYFKPVENGQINVDGIPFKLPDRFYTLVIVEGKEVFVAGWDAKPLCKIAPVDEASGVGRARL